MAEILLALAALNFLGIIILFSRSKGKSNVEDNFRRLNEVQQSIKAEVKDEISRNRNESLTTLKAFEDSVLKSISSLTQINEQKLESMRGTMQERMETLQNENNKKLDEIRVTVDDKLHNTLEKRLGESFTQVSERLEAVQKGLGQMQSLAEGVGDLKKVLTNIKTRGNWGEIQLGALLEQILSPEQYSGNVITKKGSNERVEFAIKLPGRGDNEEPVWLPIDAKFPQEDYQRLLDAQEAANAGLADKAGKQLELRIKTEAKEIKEKYIDPPNTPDFGIMFLPTEGLYAEVLRRTGLCEVLQRDFRVVVTGPTTLAALLNSLQMGFKTLAIEKRSSEVWWLLGEVKTQFAKFGDILARTHKKLQEASFSIEDASKKTRTIEKKLKNVQEMPSYASSQITEEALEVDHDSEG